MANSASGESVVDRIVRLIAAFPAGPGGLQLSELAQRSGLPLTTTHRLVQQLAIHGLLETEPGGSVHLGLRLWEPLSAGNAVILKPASLWGILVGAYTLIPLSLRSLPTTAPKS